MWSTYLKIKSIRKEHMLFYLCHIDHIRKHHISNKGTLFITVMSTPTQVQESSVRKLDLALSPLKKFSCVIRKISIFFSYSPHYYSMKILFPFWKSQEKRKTRPDDIIELWNFKSSSKRIDSISLLTVESR